MQRHDWYTMGENVVFYAFAYQQILLLFLNNSNKNGVRKHAHSMSHAYLDILVKVSSEMLQNCGNAYVKFNSASSTLSHFLSYTTFLYIEIIAILIVFF